MGFLVPVFSTTLFLSAFLLFSIQPMFSKMLLPFLGGTPMVWNVSMVFFQAMLLAGYGYAYFSSRIQNLKIQIFLHLGLFLLFLYFLPFNITADQIPNEMGHPAFWQITFMLAVIGAPFFIISGCAPLLQRWFSYSNHKNADNPYFLYAASNVGSMLALFSYPFITEPFLGLDQQSLVWTVLYGILILMIALSGFSILKNISNSSIKEEIEKDTVFEGAEVTTKQRLYWLLMAFVPSSLMLGVTTYITTDIASVPLLWIIPLALYVGTFIIVFANKQIFSQKFIERAFIIGLSVLVSFNFFAVDLMIFAKILLHIGVFFIISLACHKHLVDARPNATRLTEFYFFMSLGGVLGGIFNALLAPVLFTYTWEYTIVMILSGFLVAPILLKKEITQKTIFRGSLYIISSIIFVGLIVSNLFFDTQQNNIILSMVMAGILLFNYDRRIAFGAMVTAILLISPLHKFGSQFAEGEAIFIKRNFFGTIKVVDTEYTRNLFHGTTLHGMQFKDSEKRLSPIAYYNKKTSVGEVFTYFTDQDFKPNVAVLGLGTGGLACYDAPGRHFDFYEIDQDMTDLSKELKLFTYLDECTQNYDVIMGDARLKIDEKEDKLYDLIIADAFSSDNIPVHLVTREAMQIYASKLKDDGVILFHISNRYIDLRPVLSTIANDLGFTMLHKLSKATEKEVREEKIFPTRGVLIAKNKDIIEPMKEKGWAEFEEEDDASYLWTDNYANILNAFILVRGIKGKKIN